MRLARAGSKFLGTAMASLGSGSDCQTISVAFLLELAGLDHRVAVAVEVGRAVDLAARDGDLVGGVGGAVGVVEVLLGIDALRVRNHAVGMSQPEVEPTSAKDTRLPLPSSGHTLTREPGPADDDGVIDRLAVVLGGRDGVTPESSLAST